MPAGSQVTTLDLRDAGRPSWRLRLAQGYELVGRIVWSPDARFVTVQRPLQGDWLLVDVRSRRARVMEMPRALRPTDGGLVGWFR